MSRDVIQRVSGWRRYAEDEKAKEKEKVKAEEKDKEVE